MSACGVALILMLPCSEPPPETARLLAHEGRGSAHEWLCAGRERAGCRRSKRQEKQKIERQRGASRWTGGVLSFPLFLGSVLENHDM